MDELQREQEMEGQPFKNMRYAKVMGRTTLREVQAYMPANYVRLTED